MPLHKVWQLGPWAAHLRLQYRHLQVALSRVRTKSGEKPKAGQRSTSKPSAASSPARRSSLATEEEPEAENQPADDDDQVPTGPAPEENRDDEEVELQEDSSVLWEAHDEQLPVVLPSEVLGWLLLRRAGLTSQQRLSVQAAAGNSPKLDAIKRALKGMEEELLQYEGHGKGGREPPQTHLLG